MPNLEMQLPQTPNIEWIDKQWTFGGEWKPDIDPSLIGPTNFAELQNFRYNDSSIEGINGYTRINETYVVDGGDTVGAGGTFLKIRNGIQLRTDRTTKSFTLVQAVDGSENGRVFLNTTRVDVAGEFNDEVNLDINGNPYFADINANLEGRFSPAPQQSICYCNGEESLIYSGDEQRIAAAFLVTGAPTLTDAKAPKDVTDKMNSSLNNVAGDRVTFDATNEHLIFFTTRPIQAGELYIQTASTDGTADMIIETWTGAGWATCLKTSTATGTDGTASGDQTLQASGTVTFDAHKNSTSVLMHYQELYLYAYLVRFENQTTNVDAVLYHMTVDMAMQPIENVWDGIYRQPIQYQVYDHTDAAYKDYTLHVNQSSDVNFPVGAELKDIGTDAANDKVIIMFEEPMAGIRQIILGARYNTAACVQTVKYWNGTAYADTSDTDGTDVGGDTLAQSGLISWSPPADEESQTLFGSVGYAYELTYTAGLTNATAVTVDLCIGVPATKAVPAFAFSTPFQGRLMLGGFNAGGQGNRMDFSVSNAPDVFNGSESSMDGIQSLYFGGVEPITTATQLYNRFGASIFSMLLVMKDSEVHLLVGDNPSNFTKYTVSQTVGCPAPLTLTTAEVGFEVGQGLTRNVAIWLSHYGPMMFDGAILSPIQGINNYFDPNESEYIEWEAIAKARAWVDPTYKEWNLLIPSQSNSTTNNIWLVYDLIRKKWYKKSTSSAQTPQIGFPVMDTTGEQKIYGGIDTGYLVELEDGTSWNSTFGDGTDGTGIEQVVRTGDFFPSDNIWDYTIQRKLKLICKKLPAAASDTTLEIRSWGNAAESGSDVIFMDSDAAAGINVDFTDMDVDSDSVNETEWVGVSDGTVNLALNIGQTRIIRLIQDLNVQGWVHSWEFAVTTTDAVKGWQPLLWGIQFMIPRKDNKAT